METIKQELQQLLVKENELQQVVEEIRAMLMKAMQVTKMAYLSKGYLQWQITVVYISRKKKGIVK